MLQHKVNLVENMRSKNLKIEKKMDKTSKMEARTLPNRAQMAPKRCQDGPKPEKEHRPNKKEGAVPQGPTILSDNVANMAPT